MGASAMSKGIKTLTSAGTIALLYRATAGTLTARASLAKRSTDQGGRMTALKYWDGAAWQTVPAIPGPTGPAGATGPTGPAPSPAEPNFLRCAMTAPGWTSNAFIAALFTGIESSGDAAAYTVRASDSKAIIVRDAGTYQINVAGTSGASVTRFYTRLLLNGTQVDYHDSGKLTATAGVAPSTLEAITLKLAAGAVLTVDLLSDVVAPAGMFSITRVNQGTPGAPGAPGAEGVAGEMAAYANSGPVTSIPVAWKTMPLSATPVVDRAGRSCRTPTTRSR